MSNLDWLSEDKMVQLRPYFPKSHGVPRIDDRRILIGIISINRNGLQWCDAPKKYGLHKTLYNRWKRWSDMGVVPSHSYIGTRIRADPRHFSGLMYQTHQHL